MEVYPLLNIADTPVKDLIDATPRTIKAHQ